MQLKTSIAFIVSICLYGCATSNKIYPVQMPAKLNYYGFSINRPIYNTWFLRPTQQFDNEAILYRESTATHSTFFMVVTDTIIGNQDFDTYAKSFAEKFLMLNDSVRFILKEHTLEKLTNDSIETYRYYTKQIDKGSYNAPEKKLLMESYGFIRKHPLLPKKAVITQFSERGTEVDFKDTHSKESTFFFNSVEFKKE